MSLQTISKSILNFQEKNKSQKINRFKINRFPFLLYNFFRPQFIILASDGLWDTFSNEEAVTYIKEKLDEPHFGAKSIVLESYNRGSVDNITVMVIVFKNGQYHIGTSESD